MKIRDDVNEYGTKISVHKCADCGEEYTLCPAQPGDFGGCQDEDCSSYDPKRDVLEILKNAHAKLESEGIH